MTFKITKNGQLISSNFSGLNRIQIKIAESNHGWNARTVCWHLFTKRVRGNEMPEVCFRDWMKIVITITCKKRKRVV